MHKTLLTFFCHSFPTGFFSSIVFGLGLNKEPNPPLNDMIRTSYAHGTSYGCSFKFTRPYCWKYCTGSSGNWCYTVSTLTGYCKDETDCRDSEACQGWCAWNSQQGCAKSCHEEQIVSQQPQKSNCRGGQPYWACQSGHHLSKNLKIMPVKFIQKINRRFRK